MDGMNISEVLNVVLGGGLVATIVAISTLRDTIRKAKAESMKAEADADGAYGQRRACHPYLGREHCETTERRTE